MLNRHPTAEETMDWTRVTELFLLSRAIDELEEDELVPQKKIRYQFSSRGHELPQILLGTCLTKPEDAASVYYRSRPFMLTLGVTAEDAIAAGMAKSGGYSDGRDIGVVCNREARNSPMVLPMAGDVGSQYTPAAGYAQAILFRSNVLEQENYSEAISVVMGGDGSVATNGFWSALNMATTLNLPLLFCIEDNGYGLSVKSELQTPGGNIANNLYSFKNLRIYAGDGTSPREAAEKVKRAVRDVRNRKGPVLLRLTVPRLAGHSFQDNQAYKKDSVLNREKKNDPYPKLKQFMVPEKMTEKDWRELEKKTKKQVSEAAQNAWQRTEPDEKRIRGTFSVDYEAPQKKGGLISEGHSFPETRHIAEPEGHRINMAEAIRRTLENELELNDRLLVFGEDVGKKGGVHGVTMGLQSRFGENRVFDTGLSEEGIIGRSVGLACGGMMPVAEIQFRKYADPATEQFKNTGTIRWRTANRFATPMLVRMAGGFATCGDPWHSESNEVFFARMPGWKVACPSNAEDAAGLLRTGLRGNDPVIFFEHRYLLDSKEARRPWPGDDYAVPFGKAAKLREGGDLTVVTWGAMCERCVEAAEKSDVSAEILDLRTIRPWDREMVCESVRKTNRCLIVHEDIRIAGFGAEISAWISDKCFEFLDAPVKRLGMPQIPMPYNVRLMNQVLPGSDDIQQAIRELMEY